MQEEDRGSYPNWMFQHFIEKSAGPVIAPEGVRTEISVIKFPAFVPRTVEPMTIANIGSGQAVSDKLSAFERKMLFAPRFFAEHAFLSEFEEYIHENHAQHIGGQLCIVKIGARGCGMMQRESKNLETGAVIKLTVEKGRFVQTNSRTGVKIPLRFPCETGETFPKFPLSELYA